MRRDRPVFDSGMSGAAAGRVLESSAMNERQQAHIDFYLKRLEHWKGLKPPGSTSRLLAARDADEAHPLRTEEEAKEVVEYLWRLEREKAAGT